MALFGIGVDIISIIITFVILVGVLLGKKNAMNEYFPTLLLMNALTILADIGTYSFAEDSAYLLFLKISIIAQGSLTFVGLAGFNLYVDKLISRKIGRKPAMRMVPFIISIIMIIFWISSLLHGLCFTVDDDGIYAQGSLFFICVIVGLAIGFFDFFRVLVNQVAEKLESNVAVPLYIFMAVPVFTLPVALYIECFSLFYAALTVSYLIMFIAIHVHTEQAVVEHKMEETILQTDLTISQLQPHFMFNSLTNIKYLIKKRPELSEEAIEKFIKYLRTNLEVIQEPVPIKFSEELEHTKIYLWLEQLRFSNLKVEYSIDADDFMVPPLSLQPIVENAVKHGVTRKIGGGTVTISVREAAKYYKIMVKDDGVGFDMDSLSEEMDGQVGITNIRKRLNDMNHSTLTVSSTEGVGTTAVYQIMKEDD